MFEKLLIYQWQGTYFGGLMHGLYVCVGLCLFQFVGKFGWIGCPANLQVTVYIYGQLQLALQHPKTGKHQPVHIANF